MHGIVKYRVVTVHTPGDGRYVEWEARIYNHQDGRDVPIPQRTFNGETEEQVLQLAQEWMKARASEPRPGRTVYADGYGDAVQLPEAAAKHPEDVA